MGQTMKSKYRYVDENFNTVTSDKELSVTDPTYTCLGRFKNTRVAILRAYSKARVKGYSHKTSLLAALTNTTLASDPRVKVLAIHLLDSMEGSTPSRINSLCQYRKLLIPIKSILSGRTKEELEEISTYTSVLVAKRLSDAGLMQWLYTVSSNETTEKYRKEVLLPYFTKYGSGVVILQALLAEVKFNLELIKETFTDDLLVSGKPYGGIPPASQRLQFIKSLRTVDITSETKLKAAVATRLTEDNCFYLTVLAGKIKDGGYRIGDLSKAESLGLHYESELTSRSDAVLKRYRSLLKNLLRRNWETITLITYEVNQGLRLPWQRTYLLNRLTLLGKGNVRLAIIATIIEINILLEE